MLLLHLSDTLGVGDVLILGSFEQTVGGTHKSQRDNTDQSLGLTGGGPPCTSALRVMSSSSEFVTH